MKPGGYTNDEEAYFQRVGERIRYFRKLRNYSSYQSFAYAHNIHLSQYGLYEQGKNLNIATLRRILQALQVSHKEFFDSFDEII
ncbi:helix-turn-helix domain-containing protein [Mucilaginibacter sp. FT3.2]|uniref:helix-turn-helix domain-containing protein n=1 Tax=Mucilaginibacter sp. FT3.2 TaxID=2723090 RepID=UPI00160D4920|nr:helix-turn-helix transcriptional regulator [Mucilaginibacter sp. FT3.2]MBB6234192.1 transcriptional regulator with XRE-family HTH domain [Mucilaginibacter sp. FT3.2]